MNLDAVLRVLLVSGRLVPQSCSILCGREVVHIIVNVVCIALLRRVIVHYYAKGDKCDVTGKHRDVQLRMK